MPSAGHVSRCSFKHARLPPPTPCAPLWVLDVLQVLNTPETLEDVSLGGGGW